MHYSYEEALKGIRFAEMAGVIRVERRKIDGSSENAPSIYELLQVLGENFDHAFEVIGKTDNVVEKTNKVIGKGSSAKIRENIEITKKERRKNPEIIHPFSEDASRKSIAVDSNPAGSGMDGRDGKARKDEDDSWQDASKLALTQLEEFRKGRQQ